MKRIAFTLGICVCAAASFASALIAGEGDQTGDALARALQRKPSENESAGILRASKPNPCAALGAGFAAVPGSSTCVRIGGSVRVDAGVQR